MQPLPASLLDLQAKIEGVTSGLPRLGEPRKKSVQLFGAGSCLRNPQGAQQFMRLDDAVCNEVGDRSAIKSKLPTSLMWARAAHSLRDLDRAGQALAGTAVDDID